MSLLNKIRIGTAQFGLDYGMTNHAGKVDQKDVDQILNLCIETGITKLDTAIDYGTAVVVLGNYKKIDRFDISSKIHVDEDMTRQALQVRKMLSHIPIETIGTLFIHNGDTVEETHCRQFQSMVNEILDTNLGVSCYFPETLKKSYLQDVGGSIQCPCSLLDNRFAFDMGKYTQSRWSIRSLFLQGVLLESVDSLPNYFLRWRSKFYDLQAWSKRTGYSKLELCLTVGLDDLINEVVLGIINSTQFEQLVSAINRLDQTPPSENLIQDLRCLSSTDQQLILPTHWPKRETDVA